MKYRYIWYNLGLLLLVLSLCMLAVTGWAAWAWTGGEPGELQAIRALGYSIAVGAVLGTILCINGKRPAPDEFGLGRREALLLVALSWLIGAALGGLPYHLWWLEAGQAPEHAFGSWVSCYFESMSGMTTTGATVLSDVDSVPRSLLLWRAMTHWLGGLGIVVLFVAVLPTLGVGGKRLYRVEAPGPQKQGVRPRIRETARVLWLIYVMFTVVQVVLYRLCGMTWFDAVCHSFATIATGGFSTHNASIGYYNAETVSTIQALGIESVTMLFMLLAGINFGLYYHLARGRYDRVWRDPEMRTYFWILGVATLIIAASLWGRQVVTTAGLVIEQSGVGESLRYSLFQVLAIHTTTGFATADFNLWDFLPKAVLVTLMFFGGCAGSTGGGIKVIRILIAFKVILAEIEHIFRPNVVRTIRVGQGAVPREMQQSVLVYVLGILVLYILGAIVITLLEPAGSISIVTAATASAATLNNIGPGLELIGAVENYGFFTAPSKLVMCLLMALGRLEVYTLLVLFTPVFWRQD